MFLESSLCSIFCVTEGLVIFPCSKPVVHLQQREICTLLEEYNAAYNF